MYRVIYKMIHGDYRLSDDMTLNEAKAFKEKCFNSGYKEVHIIQIVEWNGGFYGKKNK